jgi:hypothetical protein
MTKGTAKNLILSQAHEYRIFSYSFKNLNFKNDKELFVLAVHGIMLMLMHQHRN